VDSKLTSKEVLQYALNGFFQAFAITIPMGYFNVFLTEHIGISAALLASALLVARIIDFFVCVAAGGIMESTTLKWGKYRSWLILLRWVVLAGIILSFINTKSFSLPVKVVILMLGYLLTNLPMNFIATAQMGIMTSLAGPSMTDRFRLSVAGVRIGAVSGLLTSACTLPLINYVGSLTTPTDGYTIVATAFGFLMIVGSSLLLKVSKPYDLPQVTNSNAPARPKITLKDMAAAVTTNSQLLVYLLVQVLLMSGMFASGAIGTYYYIYILGDFNLMPIAMTITTAFGLISTTIGPKIGKKLGKKNSMVASMLIGACGSIAIMFFGAKGLPYYVTISCFSMIAAQLSAGFGYNYILDIGEYGFYKTGKDTRTIIMSMMNVPMKIGMALGGSLGLYALALIGYVPGMPVPPANFANTFMKIFGGIPAACSIIGGLLIMFFYKITDADAQMYAKVNAERLLESQKSQEI
jgi:GPH family glycoside/pentoside/hexuronide:cation symporter